jgi:hypothetical protein
MTAEEHNINRETVQQILMENLGIKKFCAKMQERMEVCAKLLQ